MKDDDNTIMLGGCAKMAIKYYHVGEGRNLVEQALVDRNFEYINSFKGAYQETWHAFSLDGEYHITNEVFMVDELGKVRSLVHPVISFPKKNEDVRKIASKWNIDRFIGWSKAMVWFSPDIFRSVMIHPDISIGKHVSAHTVRTIRDMLEDETRWPELLANLIFYGYNVSEPEPLINDERRFNETIRTIQCSVDRAWFLLEKIANGAEGNLVCFRIDFPFQRREVFLKMLEYLQTWNYHCLVHKNNHDLEHRFYIENVACHNREQNRTIGVLDRIRGLFRNNLNGSSSARTIFRKIIGVD